MAGINTKVVRRSNALAAFPYGKDFRYDEAVMSGDGIGGRLKAYGNAAALGVPGLQIVAQDAAQDWPFD